MKSSLRSSLHVFSLLLSGCLAGLLLSSCSEDLSVAPLPPVGARIMITPGVVGFPDAGILEVPQGSQLTYAYTPSPGFTNLRVVANGRDVPSSGSVTVGSSLDIIAAADTSVVPTQASGQLSNAFDALLLSGTSVNAAYTDLQELTNRLYVSTDPLSAHSQISVAWAKAFDPIVDAQRVQVVFRQLSDSLFSRYSDSANVYASAEGSSVAGATTTFVYVNGIHTSPTDWSATDFNFIQPLVREAGFSDPIRFRFHPFYNRSETGELFTCLTSAAAEYMSGSNTAILTALACSVQFSGDPDLLEAIIQQVNDELGVLPALATTDALQLAARIRASLRNEGRVVLIGHSQGNMMINEALRLLRRPGEPTIDEGCIGVVSIAPPFPISTTPRTAFVSSMIAERGWAKDALLLAGLGQSASTVESELARRLDDAISSTSNGLTVAIEIPLFAVTLHGIEGHYLGMFDMRSLFKDYVTQAVNSTEAKCGIASTQAATVRVLSNAATSWTIGPAIPVGGSGTSGVHTVAPAVSGTWYTIVPGSLAGAYVTVTADGSLGSSMFVLPGDDKTFQLTYTFGPVVSPNITGVSPSPVLGLDAKQSIRVSGSDFQVGATATLRDLRTGEYFPFVPVQVVTATEVTLDANFTARTATWTVQVINPGGASSSQFTFQVSTVSPAPTISAVSPGSYPASTSNQTMTINGSDFQPGATLTFIPAHGPPISSTASKLTFVSSGQLSYQFNNGGDAGPWSVTVTNPDGQASSQLNFQVQGSTPAPVLTSVSPNPVPGLWGQQTLTVNGSNFVSGAIVRLQDLTNGGGPYDKTPTSFSSGQLQISANFTTAAATWSAQVINPDGQASSQVNFQVQGSTPAPVLTNVSPNPVSGSNSPQTLTVNGSNFVSGAIVRLQDLTNGGGPYDKTPTSFSAGQLQISANFTTATATWSAQVINPDGQASSQVNFQVQGSTPAPVLTGVSPNPVSGSNSPQTLTVNGSNFVSGAIVRLQDLTNGGGPYDKTPTSFSAGQLQISTNFTTATATWSAQVINPDGQASSQLNFQVQGSTPAPVLTGVSPNPVSGSNSPQTLTVNGSNFVSGAIVRLRDLTNGGTFDKTPTSFTSGQLQISANFTTATATWSAQVINPDGQASSQLNFQVQGSTPAPVLTGVSPNPVSGSNSPQTLTVNGSNFVSGAIVRLRDLTNGGTFDKTPTSFSSGQLQISANFTTATATWSAQVINPDGQASSQVSFQVQ